jgi:hypothetical protein
MANKKRDFDPRRDNHNRAVVLAEKHRPDLSQLKKMRIDDRTTIYISTKKDADKAVAAWLQRIAHFRSTENKKG